MNSSDTQRDELIKIMKSKSETGRSEENQQDQVRRNAILDTVVKTNTDPNSNASDSSRTGISIGEIRNGHRFKGGNPSDKANWEAVK
jgi:hypothetical protein